MEGHSLPNPPPRLLLLQTKTCTFYVQIDRATLSFKGVVQSARPPGRMFKEQKQGRLLLASYAQQVQTAHGSQNRTCFCYLSLRSPLLQPPLLHYVQLTLESSSKFCLESLWSNSRLRRQSVYLSVSVSPRMLAPSLFLLFSCHLFCLFTVLISLPSSWASRSQRPCSYPSLYS